MSNTPKNKKTLKPCPFCGCTDIQITSKESGVMEYPWDYYVYCGKIGCYAMVAVCNTKDAKTAIASWNRRINE